MNYKIVEDKSKKIFNVVETQTKFIIATFDNYQDAKNKMRFYNLGGGFDGFSPNFIIRKVVA